MSSKNGFLYLFLRINCSSYNLFIQKINLILHYRFHLDISSKLVIVYIHSHVMLMIIPTKPDIIFIKLINHFHIDTKLKTPYSLTSSKPAVTSSVSGTIVSPTPIVTKGT